MSGDRATKGKADAKADASKAADWDAQQDLVAGWHGEKAPDVAPGAETAWEPFSALVKEWQDHESNKEIAISDEDLLSSDRMILIDSSVLVAVGEKLAAEGLTSKQVATVLALIRKESLAAALSVIRPSSQEAVGDIAAVIAGAARSPTELAHEPSRSPGGRPRRKDEELWATALGEGGATVSDRAAALSTLARRFQRAATATNN